MTTLIDSTDRLHMEVDKNLKITRGVIESFQEIPTSFLDDLADQRHFQDGKFAPDEIKVASIPASVVDNWYRQGFSIWDQNVTPQDVINRLKASGLEKFLTTSRTLR